MMLKDSTFAFRHDHGDFLSEIKLFFGGRGKPDMMLLFTTSELGAIGPRSERVARQHT